MYKIITPLLLQGCKDAKVLARMIILLPCTDDPLAKRPKDIAVSIDWLSQFESPKKQAEAIREAFDNYNKLKNEKRISNVAVGV